MINRIAAANTITNTNTFLLTAGGNSAKLAFKSF